MQSCWLRSLQTWVRPNANGGSFNVSMVWLRHFEWLKHRVAVAKTSEMVFQKIFEELPVS